MSIGTAIAILFISTVNNPGQSQFRACYVYYFLCCRQQQRLQESFYQQRQSREPTNAHYSKTVISVDDIIEPQTTVAPVRITTGDRIYYPHVLVTESRRQNDKKLT